MSSQPTAINSTSGAPDPTAGASINEKTTWFLDEKILHNNIKKRLIKFCVPSPKVISNANILSRSVPPATAEWTNLLRSLCGREPEGLWNLLSIVREMFRRNDGNALYLLEVLTEEAVACDQIMVWWFNTTVALQGSSLRGGSKQHTGSAGSTNMASHFCALLCDEMVSLWRLAALNPSVSPGYRASLKVKFQEWQDKLFSRVMKHKNTSNSKVLNHFHLDKKIFVGFKLALTACDLDWDNYPLAGITYGTTCCDNGSCVHIKDSGTTAHFMGGHANWNDCGSSSRGNFYQLCLDEWFLDLESNRHLHIENWTYRNRSIMCMVCDVHVQNNNENILLPPELPPPEDGNGSIATSSLTISEVYDEPLNVSANSANFNQSSSSSTEPNTLQVNSICNTSSESQNSEDSDQTAVQKSTSSQTTPPPLKVDEYNYLYYDLKNLASTSVESTNKALDTMAPDAQRSSTFKVSAPSTPLTKLDVDWETMFARVEGLYGYGHTQEACVLGVKLIDQFLQNPPNCIIELPSPKRKRKKINPICHQLSTLASEILQKCYFLCSVLTERKEYYLPAFKIGLYGLEIPRLPASTKPLEVKMTHQEGEILNTLKRMLPLGKEQLDIIQSRAKILRDGQYKTRGESLLPLNLSSFIFECLVLCQSPDQDETKDETLGFEASVAALGMKSNISEAEHPLLCEGIRRQRSDLATKILIHYKNNPTRLAITMDKLLDREVHSFLSSAMDCCWYQIRDPINVPLMTMKNVAYNNIYSQPSQCYNSNVNNISGEDTSMTLNPVPSQTQSNNSNTRSTSHRKDNNRYKSRKRICPSQPNQASEANDHYLFELGKAILSKVGGPIQTTVVSQPPFPTQPHRALHMCAFQLSLYSLGLLNRVTPNWRSRNYSSQVTWIADHAMEIGAPASLYLLAIWDGHLTPSEVANMADRMSRSLERNTVEAAAQLALSCLKHSVALNPNEITRAILQCKNQSDHMMETACLTVEEISTNGGDVFPEVLFSIAKHWFALYMRIPMIPMQYQNVNSQGQPQQGPFVQSLNQNGNQIRSPSQQLQANYRQIHYLNSAFRVGLNALYTLARPAHKPNQAKYSRNPPFREDIQLLLHISTKLGLNYTQQFCLVVTKSVVNPFTLHDVAVESAMYLGHFNPNPTLYPPLSLLVEKCQSIYIQLLNQKLYKLSSSDYQEYVGILYSAYGAFAMTPEARTMFKDWLQSVKRSESCKKELWSMITSSLPTI